MCVVLGIRHAKRMRRIILSSASCLAPPHFSTLSHKRHDFRKNVIEHKMCVLISSITFIWSVYYLKNNSARYYQKCKNSSLKYLLLLSDCNESWIFPTDFPKHVNIKFNENASSGGRVVRCGQTDRYDEDNIRFPKFCGRPLKLLQSSHALHLSFLMPVTKNSH